MIYCIYLDYKKAEEGKRKIKYRMRVCDAGEMAWGHNQGTYALQTPILGALHVSVPYAAAARVTVTVTVLTVDDLYEYVVVTGGPVA